MNAIKYMQILEDLTDQIENGILVPGDMLPSENNLASQYGVSRMSARKGLLLLSEKGYIYSVPGKGYFVNEPRYNKHILYFDETEFVKQFVDEIRLHQVDIITPSEGVAAELNIPKKKKVILIKNILLNDENIPIAIDTKYLPYDKGQPYIEDEIGYATFPEIITNQLSLFSVKKELQLWPEISDGELNKILGLKESCPLLVIAQKCISKEGKPIAWGLMHIKKDYGRLFAVSAL